MIISSVNLINNYKFSDFILARIGEEQRVNDEQARQAKRNSLCLPSAPKEVDAGVRKQRSMRARYTEEHPRSQKVSVTDGASAAADQCPTEVDIHPAVTLETTDAFRLTADTSSLHISLKQAPELNETNIFRRLDFGPDPEGHGQLIVLQLLSNPSYFLATSHYRHLEMQSYCDDTLDAGCPDERFFRCYHSQYGVDLLQPFAHKGYYMHHIDDFIALRKLELNFRPPEEYFLFFKACDKDAVKRITQKKHDQSVKRDTARVNDVMSTTSSNSNSLTRTAVPDISKSSLKRKDSKKKVLSPITPKQGMLSCFGLGSFRKKKKNKEKGKN